MNKLFKIIIKILLISLLVLLISFITIHCWYLPRYINNRKTIELNENTDGIRIMNSNVKCFNLKDKFKKSLFYRTELIRNDIDEIKPDIIGFQEFTWLHHNYFKKVLVGYDSVLTYRDNSLFSESCPIFYRTDKFDLIDKGSFWLSKTPNVKSKDWGSSLYRICSYVVLKEKKTDKEFVIFNTHFDHRSDEARINSINLIIEKAKEFKDIPIILMGDLNAKENSKTIKEAYKYFSDASKIAINNLQKDEFDATYHNWGNQSKYKRIDYFMVSKNEIVVNTYDVLDKTYEGIYSSDHFPIYIDMKLK